LDDEFDWDIKTLSNTIFKYLYKLWKRQPQMIN
jgi:hypothetical protein